MRKHRFILLALLVALLAILAAGCGGDDDEGSEGGGFTPNSEHPDYFDFFHERAECESFNVYAPGAVRSVVDIACTPPFTPSPYGEIADLAAKLAENDVAIAPPPDARADFEYYRTHCGCDVSQHFIPDSGHLYQAHASLAQTVDVFVRWLSSRGLPPTKRG